MSEDKKNPETISDQELAAMIAKTDTGARHPLGFPGKVLFGVPLAWSLFQLWYASPLPFIFGFGVFNDTEARSIHLAFALFLAFTAYPAFSRSPRDYVPIQDWVFALLGAFSASYLYLSTKNSQAGPVHRSPLIWWSVSAACCCCWRPRDGLWVHL